MNKLTISLLILGGGVIFNPIAHGASHQNIYWKLEEIQKDVQQITSTLSKNFPIENWYTTHMIDIETVEKGNTGNDGFDDNGGSDEDANSENPGDNIPGGRSGNDDAGNSANSNLITEDKAVTSDNGQGTTRMNGAAASIGEYVILAGGDSHGTVDVLTLCGEGFKRTPLKSNEFLLTLTEAKSFLAAATIGNYAIFAGGSLTNGSSIPGSNSVDIFKFDGNKIIKVDITGGEIELRLVKDQPKEYIKKSVFTAAPCTLSASSGNLAATTIRDKYAIFAQRSANKKGVDIFKLTDDDDGTKVVKVDADGIEIFENKGDMSSGTYLTLSESRDYISAASIGDYALFAGGYQPEKQIYYDTIEIFTVKNDKVVKVDADGDEIGTANEAEYKKDKTTGELISNPARILTLSQSMSKLVATTVGDYVIFAESEPKSGSDSDTSFCNAIDVFKLRDNGTIVKIDAKGDVIYKDTDEKEYKTNAATKTLASPFALSQPMPGLAVTNITTATGESYALFVGGSDTQTVDIFYVSSSTVTAVDLADAPDTSTSTTPTPIFTIPPIPFPYVTSETYIVPEVILDENDEALAA